jgi:hypothetical protein
MHISFQDEGTSFSDESEDGDVSVYNFQHYSNLMGYL